MPRPLAPQERRQSRFGSNSAVARQPGPHYGVRGSVRCPRHEWGISQTVSLKTPQYLPWRYMIPRDIVLSTVLAFGERIAERVFLPGLHRAPDRAIADAARIDDLSVFVADVIGHNFILIWMFILAMYVMSIITKRPIKPYATAIIGGGLMIITFIGSVAAWYAMPMPPPK
jgi:hypothetical protein